jgi:GTPase SAR1 family protein
VPQSFASLSAWRDDFLHQGAPRDPETFPFVVLGNKADLAEECAVTTEQAEAWCASAGILVSCLCRVLSECGANEAGVGFLLLQCKYFDSSALENLNISQAFREVCTMSADRVRYDSST